MGAPTALLRPETLARLGGLQVVARTVVEGYLAGFHPSPYHGFSVEFSEYREYVPGDDLRHFDWKAYGKSERRYIRKYHSETNLLGYLVVDRSASMGFSTTPPLTKLRFAACVAAALAYLLHRQGDAVGLTVFSEGVETRLPARTSGRHMQDVFQALEELAPAGRTAAPAVLHEVAETFRRRGLVVVLSDFLDDPEELARALGHVRFRGHDLLALQVLDPAEIEFPFDTLADFLDMETGERLQVHAHAYRKAYRRAVADHLARLRRKVRDLKGDHLLLRTDKPFEAALAACLRARQGK